MVLEVSNASVSHDIEKVIKDFKNLDLATYPGYDISEFNTDALC